MCPEERGACPIPHCEWGVRPAEEEAWRWTPEQRRKLEPQCLKHSLECYWRRKLGLGGFPPTEQQGGDIDDLSRKEQLLAAWEDYGPLGSDHEDAGVWSGASE